MADVEAGRIGPPGVEGAHRAATQVDCSTGDGTAMVGSRSPRPGAFRRHASATSAVSRLPCSPCSPCSVSWDCCRNGRRNGGRSSLPRSPSTCGITSRGTARGRSGDAGTTPRGADGLCSPHGPRTERRSAAQATPTKKPAHDMSGRASQDLGQVLDSLSVLMVGARRFELPTPCTPCRCATRLRYAPTDRKRKV